MSKLFLKKNNVSINTDLINCFVLILCAGFFYGGIILPFLGVGEWRSFLISCYCMLAVFFVLMINFLLIKSPLLFNFVSALASPFSIIFLFVSASSAFYLGLFEGKVVLLYMVTLVGYCYFEIMECRHMPLNLYFNKLLVDNVLEIDEKGNVTYEFSPIYFYRTYFNEVQFPLSKQLKIINGFAIATAFIAIPFGQSTVYARPDGVSDSGPFIMIIVGYCLGILARHHFANIGMIYRLKKAIKRGDISVDDFA